MRKFLSLLLTFCAGLLSLVIISACSEKHTHTYGNAWTYDDVYHWHVCEDDACLEILQKAEHSITDGKCEICQYELVSKGLSFEAIKTNNTTTGYRLTGLGECSDNYVYIPNTFEGLPVCEIGEKAFMDCETLVGVSIPQNVVYIQDEAFRNCVSLETVRLEEESNCVSFGLRAFWGCKTLKSIDIPSSLSRISNLAFYGCYQLEKVNYGGTIDQWVTIDFAPWTQYATSDTNPLFFADLYINETLVKSVNLTTATRISNYAFEGSSIEEINISASVEEIGKYAFNACSKLTTVSFDENSQCTVIEEGAFSNCAVQEIIIPNSIKTIKNAAFNNCASLKTVSFDENSQCDSIWTGAFSSCRALEEIKIPRLLETVSVNTFRNCSSLKKVSFYENSQCEEILENAFQNCTSLESVYIPKSVTQMEVAFNGCSNLQTLVLPFIGRTVGQYRVPFGYIFGTTSYEGALEIEQNVYYSYLGGFYDTSTYYIPQSLKTVEVLNELTLYKGDLYNCSMIEKIVLNDELTTIGDQTFENCASLLEVQLPNSINSIGKRAFSGCVALSQISIPNSISSLQTETFDGCNGLTTIELPNSIETIGENVFRNCTSLQTVRYAGALDGWAQIAFADAYASGLFYAEELYMAGELLSGKITLTTATTISDYAFAYYRKITELEIPSGLINIGDCAFLLCTNLETVSFLENSQCALIGNTVFKDCIALKNITIPASVASIGSNLFYGCEKLEWIEIEKASQLNYFSDSMCYGCSSLKEIKYSGGNIFRVNYNAFYNCTALTDVGVDLGNTFRYAFYNCVSLESVTLKTTECIEQYAFYGCEALQNVTLPSSLTLISHHAFAESGLVKITFYEGDCTWKMRHYNNHYGDSTTLTNTTVYNPTLMATYLKTFYVDYNFSTHEQW